MDIFVKLEHVVTSLDKKVSKQVNLSRWGSVE